MTIALADFAVAVSNARASAAWWREKVGFPSHTIDGESGHAVLVAPPGERFLLHLCEGIEPVAPGNTGIAFMTDEIDQVVERMLAAGVSFPEPLTKHDWGASAKFADGDGNIFWLLGAPTKFLRAEFERRAPGGATPRPAARRSAARPTPRRRPAPRRRVRRRVR
jgi:catechol 2,3-dioxygenase-like lactoylglutathione lyase family enzyme